MPLFGFSKKLSPQPGRFQKPTPKPVPKPGLFGEKKYRSFKDLSWWAKTKAPYAPIPTYGQKIGKQQQVEYIKKMAEYGRKYLGRTHGLSDRDYDYIVKKAQKEKGLAEIKHDYKTRKELDKFVKQAQQWKKG